ncbi:phosphoribosyltransferase [Streptomyces fungicidicus]|uniref:Phosphoribosyltransferase n=1 Tax=Streptomyces fungicidicus TaxID=68203 RepID=A0A494UXW1_9ACTN|nr:phosphoribosyltransferase family protein [Streptomyces fungicidicus]AYL34498.1 phosphoribosyltransferase [Streptomyces fungicidicus]
MRFRDRRQAGRELAARLRERRDEGALPDPVVLALPRGGVAVAAEVAHALDAPLDVLVVRKIGAPFHEEFGVGAMAGDGVPVFDEDSLFRLGLSESDLAAVVARERAELRRREERYRQGRPPPDTRGRTVIVVDDGLATGSTARAALRAARAQDPGRLVLAVPVGAAEGLALMRSEADEVLCLHEPAAFMAVGQWYEEFDQLTDEDVLDALHQRQA